MTVFVPLDGTVKGVHWNPLLPAAQINYSIGNDTKQPALEGARRIVALEIVPCADVGVLRDVFRIGGVSCKPIRKVICAPLAATEKQLECCLGICDH